MVKLINRIAFGGGCHWCTEAIFQSLKGVEKVEQGYVSSVGKNSSFSEAVIVHYNDGILIKNLIEIHLHTHKSTSNHTMREKYRSAIYTFSVKQKKEAIFILESFQPEFKNELITQVLPFSEFKASRESIQNYYQKNPNKPFCATYINPKLQVLLTSYSSYLREAKISQLKTSI